MEGKQNNPKERNYWEDLGLEERMLRWILVILTARNDGGWGTEAGVQQATESDWLTRTCDS
jgi:hypothetical protein